MWGRRVNGMVIGVALMCQGAAFAGLGPPQTPVFKGGVDLVHVGVTVTDRKGTFIADLSADDFEIYEDGQKQDIGYFVRGESEESKPELHLGLLFDTSGSMRDEIGFARSAAVKFLNQLHDAVDITLVDFDTEVRVARYGQADFARLIERIRQRKADGWTALYDALGVYLDGASGQSGRKILVLYTDGGDSRSSLTFGDAIDLLKASDVTVYAIGFLRGSSSQSLERSRLGQITEVTGGQAYFPLNIKELETTYAKIESEIRAQYGLGYVSKNARTDGRWRKVDVKVRRPSLKDVKVRARRGYFALYKPVQ